MRGREGWEVQGEVNTVKEHRLSWLVPGRYAHTCVFMYMCINARLDISFLSWFPLISHVWLVNACVRVFVCHSSLPLAAGVFTELCWGTFYTWAHLRLATRQTHSNTLDMLPSSVQLQTIQPLRIFIPHATCSGLPPLPFFSVTLSAA